MSVGIDESLLTAYALDELSGAERAAVAAHLAASEEARRYVADVRSTAHILSDELTREHFGELNDLQHAAIERHLDEMVRVPRMTLRHPVRHDRLILFMSMAASILIVGGVIAVLIPFIDRHINVATQTDPSAKRRAWTTEPDADRLPSSADSDATKPAGSDKMAVNDNSAPGFVTDPWMPQPDNGLAARGSEREETSLQPPALIGVRPPDNGAAPRVAVSQAPKAADKGVDSHAPGDAAVHRSAPVKPETFARLPFDQLAPEKVSHAAAGSARSTSGPTEEAYSHLLENPFVDVAREPVSGYSAGVDTASYSNIRRFLTHGKLPPKDAVRIEEMLNYFPIRSPMVAGDVPLAMQVEIGACPWRPEHRLARVCVQALELSPDARPSVNLVFAIDVSPSMRSEKTKLPLLKQAMRLLVAKLSVRDRLSIVAYSQETGVVLPPTPVEDKQAIWAAIDRLDAGGLTTGGQGIELPYDLAARAFIRGGVNRVILATDGNWNVGVTDHAQLASIIREKSHGGISLTVLGVGMNNLQDATLQTIAAAGNGNYAYVDTLEEARKVLADQMNGALVVVARDVKVQVTFNPAAAEAYRLIGYERRAMSREELTSQSKRGGELGAGQCVTALYQVIPTGTASMNHPADMLTAAVSYSDPINLAPRMLQAAGEDRGVALPGTSTEFRFSAAVAEFGLLLHDSDYKGNATYSAILDNALQAAGPDDAGYRQEFVGLIKKAAALSSSH
ncbi:MAG TPA: VWA domain-containing protein [Tepidisphaeraceae bacterium]|jgi:Ca-activated chloride channel family protein|nr:VWA domain-containing protein [Tepidisphaeraceae bacterium]